ncbi:MAG: CRISPR system precrRNA processing endoribonuclease RAMP protein Cas6 [Eubacteriaceae bacterium]|nr:CRISPR system precrRNA processing endoribonuclease RAMP protein Cas6 [Eubacteriaceae bacterium]
MYNELEKRLSYNMIGLLNTDHSFSYSQYAEPLSSGNLLWHISCWEDELSYSIARAVHSMATVSIRDREKTIQLRIVRYESKSWSDEELASDFFASDPIRLMGFRIITPALHKNEGKYLLFPAIDLIYFSIARRCQTIMDRFSFRDKGVLSEMIQQTKIWQYELRTVPYEINGSNVIGFRGAFQIKLDGTEEIARASGLVLSLAEFTGIGLKTVEGMGACKVVV